MRVDSRQVTPSVARQTAAIAGAVLILGLVCGWIVKSWSVSGKAVSAGARHSSSELPSDGTARRGLASGEDGTANLFLGRLHDVLGTRGSARRSHAILALVDGMNQAQIRQALSSLEKTHLADRYEIRDPLLATLAETEPQDALHLALAVKSASERSSAVQAVVRSWAGGDAAAAEKWVTALPPGRLRDSTTIGLAMTAADSDFEHALVLAQSVVMGPWQVEGRPGEKVEALFEKVIADDPVNTMAVTAKLGRDPVLTAAAFKMVGQKWAKGDLDGATRWMQFLSETELQKNGSAVTPIFEAWLKNDAASATGWLAQLPDRAAKNSLLQKFADSRDEWRLEPITAIGLAVMMPPGPRQDDAVTSITKQWAGSDPDAASAWALAQPDGPVRTAALQSVASKWLSIDPPAATKWFNALPDDPQKSQILSGVVKRVIYGDEWGKVGTDESLALQMSSHLLPNIPGFISALDDPKKKAEAYEAFAGIWLQRNRRAAEAWLNTAPLPQATKDRLLRPPPAKTQSSEAVPEAYRQTPERYFTAADESGTAPAASHDLKAP